MANIFDKLPNDVTQIGVGAIAGTVTMFAAQHIVAVPMYKKVQDYRKKLGDLKEAGKNDEAAALEKKPPLGVKVSGRDIRDISVLTAGILGKALAPKNTFTEYATDGMIFFALTSLITKNINFSGITYEYK